MERGQAGSRLWCTSSWPDYDDCDLPALCSYDVAADQVGHYMVPFLSQMYKMRELFHAADVKSRTKEAERFQGAPKEDVVFALGGGHLVLVLLVPLALPHSLEHSLGLVHLVLLLLHPLTHSGVGILRIGSM